MNTSKILFRRKFVQTNRRLFTNDFPNGQKPLSCEAAEQPISSQTPVFTNDNSTIDEQKALLHYQAQREVIQKARQQIIETQLKKESIDNLNEKSKFFSDQQENEKVDISKSNNFEPIQNKTEQKTSNLTEKQNKEVENTHESKNVERAIQKKKFSLKEFIVEEWHKLKASLRQIKTDSFRMYIYLLTKNQPKDYMLVEYIDYMQIKIDVLKFIPFSILLALPGGELVIPPYIGLFPNSIPSQFLNEKSIGKKNEKKEEMQKEAFEALYKKIQSFFNAEFEEIAKLKKEIKANPFDRELYRRIADIDKEISRELIENWVKYQKKLKFNNLSIDEMDYVMKFMFVDYIKGVHIVNLMMNLHRKTYNLIQGRFFKTKKPLKLTRYTFNFFPLNMTRKLFLRWQLNRQFKRLQFEDYLTDQHSNSMEKLSSTQIYIFAHERGCRIEHDVDRIKYHERVWKKDLQEMDNVQKKFWVMLMRFSYGKYLV